LEIEKSGWTSGGFLKLSNIRALLVGAALLTPGCFADVIPISSVTASSTFSSYNVQNLINGSGISGGLSDDQFENEWITNGTTTGTLVFDLGAVFSLADAQVWNYNADCCGLERGVQTMTVLTSLDDVTFTPLNTFGLSEGTGLPLAPNVLDLAGASARYVEFDLTQNYGDAGFIGLSEVQFDSSAIPEPSAAFFLIGGLSVLALVRHRAARP
jgi:hypothetical protein